jgi:hypothetical protein
VSKRCLKSISCHLYLSLRIHWVESKLYCTHSHHLSTYEC